MPSPYELDLTAAQINTALNNAHDSGNPPESGSGKLVNSDQIHSFVTNQVESLLSTTGLIYSGATGTLNITHVFQNLDLSNIVGVNRAMVYLEVWDGDADRDVYFREKDDNNIRSIESIIGASVTYVGLGNRGGLVVCPTNASGVIEYKASSAVDEVNYRVVAYEVMRIL